MKVFVKNQDLKVYFKGLTFNILLTQGNSTSKVIRWQSHVDISPDIATFSQKREKQHVTTSNRILTVSQQQTVGEKWKIWVYFDIESHADENEIS